MDMGITEVVTALKEKNMWDILIFVSDNGGPLDHTTNSPLRGGKCVSSQPQAHAAILRIMFLLVFLLLLALPFLLRGRLLRLPRLDPCLK